MDFLYLFKLNGFFRKKSPLYLNIKIRILKGKYIHIKIGEFLQCFS